MDFNRTVTPAGTPATPSVRKGMENTGREPGAPIGDSPEKPKVPAKAETRTSSVKTDGMPSNVNKGLWEAARHAAVNMGGLQGGDKKAQEHLIREHYDKMIEQDKKDKAWAGDGDDNGILGDI